MLIAPGPARSGVPKGTTATLSRSAESSPSSFVCLTRLILACSHGDGHEQNQDTAANPEGAHRYSEEAKDGVACEQDNNENDSHGDRSHEAVFIADPFSLIRCQVNENRDDSHRVDNGQQGGKEFEVFAYSSCFHMQNLY